MNLNQVTIARDGYTFLDLFSDIGGIQGFLFSSFSFLILVWNYNMLENYMVTRLYKLTKPNAEKQVFRNLGDRSTFMFAPKCSGPTAYFRDLFPSCCCCSKCCKPSRLKQGIIQARENLQGEVNIIDIIKSRRYTSQALKLLLTK